MAYDDLFMKGAMASAAMVLSMYDDFLSPQYDSYIGTFNIEMTPVASFTKEVNRRLAKRPLKTNGRLANFGLTSLVKEATGHNERNDPVSPIDIAETLQTITAKSFSWMKICWVWKEFAFNYCSMGFW